MPDHARFALAAPLGFCEPIDSRACSTPWSVFQDGSDGVPGPRDSDPGCPVTPRGATAGAARRRTASSSPPASGSPPRRATPARGVHRRRSSPARSANAAAACNTTRERVATLPPGFRRPDRRSSRSAAAKCTADGGRRLNDDGELAQFRPFASERFHVLLNSLFKVLCNFPSRYLFAIGLALGI